MMNNYIDLKLELFQVEKRGLDVSDKANIKNFVKPFKTQNSD